MDNGAILTLITAALNEVAPNRSADFEGITLETKIENLGLDSIATMEMVGFLEEKVDSTFPDEELAKVASVADLAGLVRGSAPV